MNFNSKKLHLKSVLAERRTLIVLDSHEKLIDMEEKMESLQLIRDNPKDFVHNFFADLKNMINLKADEARAQIEKEQWFMNKQASNYENMCSKISEDESHRSEMKKIVDELLEEFEKRKQTWNESLSEEKVISEDVMQKTKLEISEFYKKIDLKFDELQVRILRGKVYKLETVNQNDFKFGELVAKTSKDVLNECSNQNGQGKLRPQSKLIRFELRPTKKKS